MRDTTKVLIAIVVTAVLVGGGAAIGSGGGSGSSGSSSANNGPRSGFAPRAAFGGGAGDRAFGAPGPHVGGLDAAATYLGLSEDALHSQLEAGKTLAQVAQAQGKSVQGLKDAIVADAKSHLDAAVKDGRITQAQADAMLTELKSHVDDLVNGKLPARGSFRGPKIHAAGAAITA